MGLPQKKWTLGDFLDWENQQEEKHEFVNGEIVAMSGGSSRHAILQGTLYRELGTKLLGKPCFPVGSDQRLHVLATGLLAYPDLQVICGPWEKSPNDPHAIINPRVIFEVLSPSTELYDRRDKFAHYRQIPSLQTIGFVSQEERRIDLFQRLDETRWELTLLTEGQLHLRSLEISLSIDTLYADADRLAPIPPSDPPAGP